MHGKNKGNGKLMEHTTQNVYGVILAGGGGTRFWPLSRQQEPKQLLNLSGKDLLICETIDRMSLFIPKEHMFIVTNVHQVEKMRHVTKGRIPKHHILSEPMAKNTSACIGYAATEIIKKYGDGILCILPADHFIKDTEAFLEVLKQAVMTAETKDKLITIGISPTYPATGYGYIKFDKDEPTIAKTVLEFKEKPDRNTAKIYLEDKNYVWNSGIFVWKASTILENIKKFLPALFDGLQTIGSAMRTAKERQTIERIYPSLPSISIDYGILEKSKDILVISGTFGWSDVGSWENIDVFHKKDENGNILIGNQVAIDTKNCISYAKKRLIATVGVENLIIVETEDAILVCDKNHAQDVKRVSDVLKETKQYSYL